MTLPQFSMRQLLEAGVHFGHQTYRWNPKMGPYIFGNRNNISIIDLSKTVPLLHQALKAISDTVAGGGRVLFVGTKRQATEAIAEAAKRSAQYYINHRWLGGTLTNWKTISNSINTMNDLDKLIEEKGANFNKKELLSLSRKRDNLELALGGIKDMGGHPNLIFIVDTVKEKLAVAEARHLGIPVVAVVDSNSDPDPIDYPIPGNDDAIRAIDLYCDLAAKAAIDGLSRAQINAGVDIGASEIAPQEQLDDMITGDESNAGKDQANDGSSGVDNSTQEVVSDAGAKPDSKIKPEVIAESETPAEKKSESAANDDTPAASTQADSVSEEAKASTK